MIEQKESTPTSAGVTVTNMSTPASFGVEWRAGDHGTRFQLANPRGTRTLLFGAKPDGASQWITTTVVDPSRFGLNTPPRTFAQFRRIVDAYINA
ncbi:hypothetical protein [Actinophytocola xanthii]|uniref:Uncharacterized protein n=1 Tax=Actinophytocola xanthii TaxID=1912961 RepID=A0A1Q8C2I7_9PSEU|nr:hypothetical protein [Actinophytocola xanthii]OLF08552.1 hypothetical protein BU204_34230 [Actinophytocola xanthii]